MDKEDSSITGRYFFIPVVLTLITIIIGYFSFSAIFPTYPFSRKLYYTFQLFSMDSGDRLYENGTPPLMVEATFNLARFLAIITLITTVVMTILSMFKHQFLLTKVKYMKGHTLLIGLGDIGKAFADHFVEKKKLLIVEKDESNINLLRLKEQGVTVIDSNALDEEVLKRIGLIHVSSLYVFTGNDFDNLTIVKAAIKLFQESNENKKIPSIAANINSRNLKAAATEIIRPKNIINCELNGILNSFSETAVDCLSHNNKEKKIINHQRLEEIKDRLLHHDTATNESLDIFDRIKLFNINELAAKYIFNQYPPDRFRAITDPSDDAMHILILGYSLLGEEIFKIFARNCHYFNRKNTLITIITNDEGEASKEINLKYNEIFGLIDIQMLCLDPHHLTKNYIRENQLTKVDVIYVCSDVDSFQTSYAYKAKKVFGDKIPIIQPFYNESFIEKLSPTSDNVFPFQLLKTVLTQEIIMGEALDHKAMAVHNRWLKREISSFVAKVEENILSGTPIPAPKRTLVPWSWLDEDTRDDNRSVVAHMNVKLRAIGQQKNLPFFTQSDTTKIDYSFLSNKETVDILAQMEHRRWMANKILCGWEYSPIRNDYQKEHNNLVSYEQLDIETQEYDVKQILEMPEIVNLK